MPDPKRAAIVFPLHDPTGLMLGHLTAITPRLKALFARAYVGLTPVTEQRQAVWVQRLAADEFFVLNGNQPGSLPGEHFLSVFASAAAGCPPEQVVHLANPDRVAFALQTEYAEAFTADVLAAARRALPLLFQRSAAAWATHPSNYREAEARTIRLGEAVFGRTYDFAWSHLVLTARQLAELMLRLECRDFALLAEMVLLLRADLRTLDVDWLAWEDPFIYGRDAGELRREREADPEETRKRDDGNRPLFELVRRAAVVLGKLSDV
jgi:hypothetical protein